MSEQSKKSNSKIVIKIQDGQGQVLMEGSKMELLADLATLFVRNEYAANIMGEALALCKTFNKDTIKS